jgi:hypothetical protein
MVEYLENPEVAAKLEQAAATHTAGNVTAFEVLCHSLADAVEPFNPE